MMTQLDDEHGRAETTLFFRGLQTRRRQPSVYMRGGFELAQFAFQKITVRSWLRIFQFLYDAGSFRVQIVINVGL
ncbi:hypothetical protein [Bradyrhizobium uaiense]|uniref:hypothetical protein n=1 Tax=Bradyrhizobium uaiense TaxID=2594946 RepID=UPI0013D4A99C|nr:hypothetical protein [Bradyrhizobium uaiense]